MTTGERMRAARKACGYSAEYIAKILGVSPATIYRYEKGDIEKVPGDLLEPLAAALHTTPAYLMGWEDSPLVGNIIPIPRMNSVPLIGTIACGVPILAEENVEEYVDLPEHIKADFALRCKGDSMTGARINDGDIVYIRQQPEVQNGEIAAVVIEDAATLKRVYRNGETVILQPENPAYPPLAYSGPDLEAVRILGKAVAFTSII